MTPPAVASFWLDKGLCITDNAGTHMYIISLHMSVPASNAVFSKAPVTWKKIRTFLSFKVFLAALC